MPVPTCGIFPYLPKLPGWNRRQRRAAELLRRVTRLPATDTSVWGDDVWIVVSTPVECGRYRERGKRSELAGWAEYGYRASHSRFFWGLRLHLVCTLQGLPIAFALTGAKADERESLLDLLGAGPHLVAARPGQTLIGDKNYFGRDVEYQVAEQDIRLLRPARKGEPERSRAPVFKAVAAGHRVGRRDLQGPAQPRTAPRPHTGRRIARVSASSR